MEARNLAEQALGAYLAPLARHDNALSLSKRIAVADPEFFGELDVAGEVAAV